MLTHAEAKTGLNRLELVLFTCSLAFPSCVLQSFNKLLHKAHEKAVVHRTRAKYAPYYPHENVTGLENMGQKYYVKQFYTFFKIIYIKFRTMFHMDWSEIGTGQRKVENYESSDNKKNP